MAKASRPMSLLFPGGIPDFSEGLCTYEDFDADSWYAEDAVLREVCKRICAGCQVRLKCLNQALAEESQQGWMAFGVRGGLAASERQQFLDIRVTEVEEGPDGRLQRVRPSGGREAR